MRTLLLVLLLGGPPNGTEAGTVTTPIGVFVVPEGCRSGRIDYGIDAFMGSIECPKHGLSITVFGYAGGIVDPCDPSGPRATATTEGLLQDPFRMTLETGVPVSICRKKSKGTRGEVSQALVVGIGPDRAELSARVRDVKQAVLMLQIVATMRKGGSDSLQPDER